MLSWPREILVQIHDTHSTFANMGAAGKSLNRVWTHSLGSWGGAARVLAVIASVLCLTFQIPEHPTLTCRRWIAWPRPGDGDLGTIGAWLPRSADYLLRIGVQEEPRIQFLCCFEWSWKQKLICLWSVGWLWAIHTHPRKSPEMRTKIFDWSWVRHMIQSVQTAVAWKGLTRRSHI